jgi:hypothetical protein
MTRRLPSAAFAGLLLLGGCYTSTNPQGYFRGAIANGVSGVLRVHDGRTVRGELLEVRDSAYVLLVSAHVTVVPYRTISSAKFEEQDWTMSGFFANPSPQTRERLRWDSRFPFGIRPAAMDALLRASGQTEPDVITSLPSR